MGPLAEGDTGGTLAGGGGGEGVVAGGVDEVAGGLGELTGGVGEVAGAGGIAVVAGAELQAPATNGNTNTRANPPSSLRNLLADCDRVGHHRAEEVALLVPLLL